MATSFACIRTPIISATALSDPRKPDSARRSNWWSPIFGWPADPNYIGSLAPNKTEQKARETGRTRPDKTPFIGCLTEEKARELRRKTIESSSFHDVMYHSAIASRLASDVSRRGGR